MISLVKKLNLLRPGASTRSNDVSAAALPRTSSEAAIVGGGRRLSVKRHASSPGGGGDDVKDEDLFILWPGAGSGESTKPTPTPRPDVAAVRSQPSSPEIVAGPSSYSAKSAPRPLTMKTTTTTTETKTTNVDARLSLQHRETAENLRNMSRELRVASPRETTTAATPPAAAAFSKSVESSSSATVASVGKKPERKSSKKAERQYRSAAPACVVPVRSTTPPTESETLRTTAVTAAAPPPPPPAQTDSARLSIFWPVVDDEIVNSLSSINNQSPKSANLFAESVRKPPKKPPRRNREGRQRWTMSIDPLDISVGPGGGRGTGDVVHRQAKKTNKKPDWRSSSLKEHPVRMISPVNFHKLDALQSDVVDSSTSRPASKNRPNAAVPMSRLLERVLIASTDDLEENTEFEVNVCLNIY